MEGGGGVARPASSGSHDKLGTASFLKSLHSISADLGTD